ncbi:hypothetical protein [Burkholderia gladioli]|uniref:hypothetical protein n=1 Tax=Burkholderia gladioli TaxID=28095 RepID=UPI0015E79DD0|nr:hypothetical protein [Burkholderia gladioli]MBA1366799.1 hypothetical protein [Burkholderia gladioli]
MTNNTTAPALTERQRMDLLLVADDMSVSGDAKLADALRALLTSPRAAVAEGWKLVPIERSYDMRIKALIAFNTAEKETNDRDDALDAAHRAMLDAAPAAPVAEPANVDLALIVAALEHSKPTHDHYHEARERHRKALESARRLVAGDQAVAADGDSAQRVADGLEACDWSGVPIGNKAIIKHAISLLRAAVSPAPTVEGAHTDRVRWALSDVCREAGITSSDRLSEAFARAMRRYFGAAVSPATADGLPAWFDMFLTNVCEIPDRNSPEGEPDAIVATLEELKNCALNAIEGGAGDEPVVFANPGQAVDCEDCRRIIDYVHCIGRTHVDFYGQSWCGRNIRSEFHFLDLDHAVENNRQGGRLVPCPACVAAATAYLASPAPAIPMPPLNDAMRAIMTNENCIYGTPDELYAALGRAAPAISESEDASDCNQFFAGICVALQVLTTHDQGVIWKDIVKACGVDDLLQYAANVEPEEWQLAGFAHFARRELGRRKPAARKGEKS